MVKKTALILGLTLFLTALITGVNGIGSFMENIIGNILFSNKGYAKNIEIQTYLMSEDKLKRALGDKWEGEAEVETNDQIYNKETYLVLHIKNKGEVSAWGMLHCVVNRSHTKVYVGITPPTNRMFSYMIPLGTHVWSSQGEYPEIQIYWENLYTK